MADVIEQAVETKPGKSLGEKRKERLARVAAQNKLTLILETDVRRFIVAQAKEAGMDVTPYLQKLIENHVMESAPEGDALGDRLRAKRAVLDKAVSLSREIDQSGGFDEHFILTVMKKAGQDAEFARLYALAAGGDGGQGKRAAREKVSLNQQLGRLIKRAAGARSKRDESGKIQRAQVQDELITTYTLLEKDAA